MLVTSESERVKSVCHYLYFQSFVLEGHLYFVIMISKNKTSLVD